MLKIAALLIALIATPALAEEPPPYLDDRSSPEQLVRSYYNAIDRYEYARAFSYVGAAEQPDFDSWQFNYDGVVRTTLKFGQTAQEGAAGSTYYQVPVEVDYERDEGEHHIDRGCFTIRWLNPANQARPPFEPMYITDVNMHAVDDANFAPADCNGPIQDPPSPPMLDDRSSPEQLVRSFYNAVRLREYGRAYSYFGPNSAPQNYEAWYTALDAMKTFELTLGMPHGHTTAGWISFSVPVSLQATGYDGTVWSEIGCVGVYWEMPNDEQPYIPMHLTGITLERNAKGAALPACDD